jgi:NAD(P)-dependent dehydrogenase (short-subunit alcohol dehydrogenase family)
MFVVNNAGLMSIGLAEGYTEGQAPQQLDVNFLGPVRVCRAALPHLRAKRTGLLIRVTSISAGCCSLDVPSIVPANSRMKPTPRCCTTS